MHVLEYDESDDGEHNDDEVYDNDVVVASDVEGKVEGEGGHKAEILIWWFLFDDFDMPHCQQSA